MIIILKRTAVTIAKINQMLTPFNLKLILYRDKKVKLTKISVCVKKKEDLSHDSIWATKDLLAKHFPALAKFHVCCCVSAALSNIPWTKVRIEGKFAAQAAHLNCTLGILKVGLLIFSKTMAKLVSMPC